MDCRQAAVAQNSNARICHSSTNAVLGNRKLQIADLRGQRRMMSKGVRIEI